MLSFLKRFGLMSSRSDWQSHTVASAVIKASRAPSFYAPPFRVPDTVRGRFEWASMHLIILCLLFNQASEASNRSGVSSRAQDVFDAFFKLQDQAWREAGTGDLAVPKRMKNMLSAYYGRSTFWQAWLTSSQSLTSLNKFMARTLFNDEAYARHSAVQACSLYSRNFANLLGIYAGKNADHQECVNLANDIWQSPEKLADIVQIAVKQTIESAELSDTLGTEHQAETSQAA